MCWAIAFCRPRLATTSKNMRQGSDMLKPSFRTFQKSQRSIALSKSVPAMMFVSVFGCVLNDAVSNDCRNVAATTSRVSNFANKRKSEQHRTRPLKLQTCGIRKQNRIRKIEIRKGRALCPMTKNQSILAQGHVDYSITLSEAPCLSWLTHRNLRICAWPSAIGSPRNNATTSGKHSL